MTSENALSMHRKHRRPNTYFLYTDQSFALRALRTKEGKWRERD